MFVLYYDVYINSTFIVLVEAVKPRPAAREPHGGRAYMLNQIVLPRIFREARKMKNAAAFCLTGRSRDQSTRKKYKT